MAKEKTTDFNVSAFVRSDPTMAAAMAKIMPPQNAVIARDSKGDRTNLQGDFTTFFRRMARRGKSNCDAQTILKILPDLGMAIRIMVSSILSPSDMCKTEVTYQAPKGVYTSDLSGSLISELTAHFETDYKVKELLHEILMACLQDKGAHPIAIIPENALDQYINGRINISKESFREYTDDKGLAKPVGILGDAVERKELGVKLFSAESYDDARLNAIDRRVHMLGDDGTVLSTVDHLLVVDNPILLKFPKVHARMKRMAAESAFQRVNRSFSLESELSDRHIEAMLYANRNQTKHEPYGQIKPQSDMSRRSVGAPLRLVLPTEALAPVHVPGEPSKHIGYFLAVDGEGNPVTMTADDAYYNTVGKGLSQPGLNNGSVQNSIMQRIHANFGGGNQFDAMDSRHIDYASQIWAEFVERDLIARVKNGVHGSAVSVAGNQDFYRVMLARTLQSRYTQILYIPAQYVTYFAFSYDDFGMGQSLLDETSMVNTLRSVLQFSNVIAAVRNSIGRTHVEVTVPDDDPDWEKTAEETMHKIVRSRQLDIPYHVTSANDITRFIAQAGFDFTFTGKDIPNMKVDFSQTQSSYPKADTELMDDLRKQAYMGIGVPAQTVDNGFSGDLATTVVANNVLLGKRVMAYQEKFCPMIAQHLRQYITHHQPLIEKMRDIVIDNLDKIKYDWTKEEEGLLSKLEEAQKKTYIANRTLRHFLDGMTVTLPEPPTVTVTNLNSEFDAWKEGMGKAIDMYISTEFLTEATGGMELSGHIDTIKAMVIAYFGRQWMANRGMMPELGALVAVDEDGHPQVDLIMETTKHVEGIVRTCVQALAKVKPMAAAADADLQRMGTPEGSGGEGGSDEGGGEDDTSGGFGGDSDMDLGSDTQPEAAPQNTEEEAPPQADQ